MDFLKWYKNKIETGNLEPPESVWENVQDQLDIDHSWQKINAHLEQKATVKRQFWYAAAAGLLIFILAGGYWWYSSYSNSNLEKQMADQTTVIENDIDKPMNEKIEKIENNKSEESTESIKKQNISHTITPQETIQLAETIVDKQSLEYIKEQEASQGAEEKARSNERLIASLIQPLEVNIDYLNKQDIKKLAITEPNEIVIKSEKESVAFQKIYAGATGQLANTWLLNEKTYTGMDRSSLIASNASFGSNFGVFTGANLFEWLFIQLDLNVISQNKQDYNEYLSGQYISNEMEFNYSQLGLSLRYIALSNRYMKGEHNVYAGGYWGYLHSAYQIIDDERVNITNDYSQSDYGVFLGYEYIFPLYKNLGFGTGVKATYGLNNIYSGNQYIPSYLNKTHNASLNITFSLKYSIK